MGQKDYIATFGNGHRENVIFTIDADESVTLYFKDSGTDTTSIKYLDIKQHAKKVSISVSIAATITKISNQELRFPKTLSVGGNFFTSGIEWSSIEVRADQDNTTFEVYAS